MLTVYFEDNRHITATPVAIFDSEELYMACLPILEKMANKNREVVTESVNDKTLKNMCMLVASVDENERQDITKLSGQEVTMQQLNDSIKGEFELLDIEDFICQCNDEEINLVGNWVTHVFIVEN